MSVSISRITKKKLTTETCFTIIGVEDKEKCADVIVIYTIHSPLIKVPSTKMLFIIEFFLLYIVRCGVHNFVVQSTGWYII